MRISDWRSDVCSSDLLKGVNDDQTKGIDIVRKAITAPVKQIAANAGHDGAVVAGNLLREDDETQGFNAATDTYENLVAAGVIDQIGRASFRASGCQYV